MPPFSTTLECVRQRPDAALPTRLQLGAPVQKLFPGVAGGAGYVKAVSAALPMLNINPTVSVFLFHWQQLVVSHT